MKMATGFPVTTTEEKMPRDLPDWRTGNPGPASAAVATASVVAAVSMGMEDAKRDKPLL